MRDNIEGQSAEPVANGSVSGSSNIAGPISAATGTNQPAATASAATPTNTPVINTSGTSAPQQGSIDFAAMSKSKEEQTDEELLTNALTKKDKAEAKKIIAQRKKEAEKAQKAARKSKGKNRGLIIGIIAVILVAATIAAIWFFTQKPAEEETFKYEDYTVIVSDPDFDYRTSDAMINEQKIKQELINHAYDGVDLEINRDAAKIRSNMDAVVDAQPDEYVQQYYRLYEIIILLENSYLSEADELLASVDEGSLDYNQHMPYYYAMYLYNKKILDDQVKAEDYLTKYSNYF